MHFIGSPDFRFKRTHDASPHMISDVVRSEQGASLNPDTNSHLTEVSHRASSSYNYAVPTLLAVNDLKCTKFTSSQRLES